MNLASEKGKRVAIGGKGRGEISGEVTGVVANVPTTNGLEKKEWTV